MTPKEVAHAFPQDPQTRVYYIHTKGKRTMTTTNQNIFYVATEDGEHMDVFDRNLSIFEALASYHKAINDGDEGYILELELGEWDYDNDGDMEPILFHEF